MKTFRPGVVIDGQVVYPTNWMWIVGFALAGCQWALDMVADPEYNLREKIREHIRLQQISSIEDVIRRLEEQLTHHKTRLAALSLHAEPKE